MQRSSVRLRRSRECKVWRLEIPSKRSLTGADLIRFFFFMRRRKTKHWRAWRSRRHFSFILRNARRVVLTSVREFLRSARRPPPKQPSSTKPPLNQPEIRDQDGCQEPMVFPGLCHRRNPRSLNEYLVILLNVLVCCHLFVLLLRLNVDSEVFTLAQLAPTLSRRLLPFFFV